MIKSIVPILLDNDAKVYGECVRQFVLTDTCDAKQETNINKLKATMTFEECDAFLHECRQSSMKVCLVSGDPTDSIKYASDVELARYEITLDITYWKLLTDRYPIPLDLTSIERQCLEQPPVIVDIIKTCSKVEEPFHETIDFECNSLFLTKSGLHVSTQVDQTQNEGILSRYHTLNRVVEDIKQKRAKLMYSTAPHMQERADDLIHQGWTIYDETFTTCTPRHTSSTEELDICIICHGELTATHYKMQCCNAHYHKNCLASSINEGYDRKCMMCQQEIYLDDYHMALLG